MYWSAQKVFAVSVFGFLVGVGMTLLLVTVWNGPMWSVDTAWADRIVNEYHPSGPVTMPAWSQYLKWLLSVFGYVALGGAAVVGAVLELTEVLTRKSAQPPPPLP